MLPERRGVFDPRRDQLSQAGARRRSASRVSTAARLARSRIAKSRSPPRCGPACAAWWLGARAVSAGRVAHARARERARDSWRASGFRRNGGWRCACCGSARASGLTLTAVLGRCRIWRRDGVSSARCIGCGCPYAVGISSHLTVFRAAAARSAPRAQCAAAARAPDGVWSRACVPIAVRAR